MLTLVKVLEQYISIIWVALVVNTDSWSVLKKEAIWTVTIMMTGVLPAIMVHNYSKDDTLKCYFFHIDVPEQGEVMIISSNYHGEGTPWVWLGQWGRLSRESWTTENSLVVCRQLGWNNGIKFVLFTINIVEMYPTGFALDGFYYSEENLTMRNVQCVGTERTVIDCLYTSGGSGIPLHLVCFGEWYDV